ncbi:hypothetical protein GGR95_000763 [Sulfitobacter undariae]|uniref:Uncharacterized protein n=1 Tax=Sulfitobacter undariae TaxID=1563671 RepID=A0A7W6E6W5_9RHOB|nr:hypothetical protein [Sulfitobacter undariae]
MSAKNPALPFKPNPDASILELRTCMSDHAEVGKREYY